MGGVILGSEAVASGVVTRGQLRWNYRAIYPDVYLPSDTDATMATKAAGAWLWYGRRAVITGRAAASLHGALWVDDATPVELVWANNHSPVGIVTHRDRIADDEICDRLGIAVATAARAALDLGRKLPRDKAVRHLDALARATGITMEDVQPLTKRYAGTKGVRLCRIAVELMDGGSQSPQRHGCGYCSSTTGTRGPKPRSRSTNTAPQSLTSTWVGHIFEYPLSTTATSTALTGALTSRKCDVPNSSTVLAG